ncbi:hypothetical protein B0A58_00810 [Flavobacterium branchiophilum NBRC 15030 = ATCC 35035]|nr:hypothetical protein B0A58_00810 [Flavobacterium branchiophilum NBRC 15030 = ATCC 35035]
MSSPFIFGVCLNNPIVDDDFIVIKFFILIKKRWYYIATKQNHLFSKVKYTIAIKKPCTY